jgi:hypothetical protein
VILEQFPSSDFGTIRAYLHTKKKMTFCKKEDILKGIESSYFESK